MKRERLRARIRYKIKRTKEPLYYVPQFTGLYENWSKKWINKHYWRIASIIGTKEDALQQCAEVYIRCRNKYGDKQIDPSHFMALYKTSIMREWDRLANKDTANREHIVLAEVEHPGREYNAGPLAAAYAKSSWELKYVLAVIVEAPAETLKVMFAMASMNDLNQRILKMCGLRSRRNVVRELKRLCKE